jgi:Putative Flp pilus-assembly TadE/G-like
MRDPSAIRNRRRGSATLWMIIWLPCLMAMFCALVGVANLWLARIELENAMESAALAAVKQWGDVGGGDTLNPRQICVAYAHANSIRGIPVVIETNYNAGGGANQNDECDVGMSPPMGNLIFGAIDDIDPTNVIFNAGIAPSCFRGTVLIDATANGSGNLAQDNAWGISFYNTPSTPPALQITRVLINLRGNGASGSFLGPAFITDNSPQPAVHDNSGNSQPDLVGFTDPANQIQFSYPSAGILQIDFSPDLNPAGGTDPNGFAPGDRFRFGQDVTNVSKGSGGNDGDGIGRDGTTVTIFFSLGGIPLPPLTGIVGTFRDNNERSNDCIDPAEVSPITGTLIVSPALVPDLPCPPTSSPNNNGQSYVLINSTGQGKFGVRAQAMIPVQPLGLGTFLGTFTEYCVQAKATAQYDCATRRVKLIRVHTFICPGP